MCLPRRDDGRVQTGRINTMRLGDGVAVPMRHAHCIKISRPQFFSPDHDRNLDFETGLSFEFRRQCSSLRATGCVGENRLVDGSRDVGGGIHGVLEGGG